ncbi:hypothetical protein BGZ67_005608, partial [Mortierella alpina]
MEKERRARNKQWSKYSKMSDAKLDETLGKEAREALGTNGADLKEYKAADEHGPPQSMQEQLWDDIVKERTRLEEESQDKLTFYSDGSLTDMGKTSVSMAFGVVQKKAGDQYRDIVGGQTEGHASSTKAELVGLLATIMISPRDRDVQVFIDNEAVVKNFRKLVKNRANATQRQKVRTTYAGWWTWVADEYQKQGSRITVTWVRGHAGDRGNEAADLLAKRSHHARHVWNLDARHFGQMKCHAKMGEQLLEDDVRRTLRIQSAARIHYQWTEQNRTKGHIKDWRKVDWTASLAIIHDKNQPMSLHTSPSDCSKRAHRIKKLHGMLPTLTAMKQRKPDLYDDDSCRRCYEQYPTPETEEHMWDCPESMETQRIGWKKAIEMVNHDGNRMVNKQEKGWERSKKKAEQSRKPFTTPRPTFTSLPAKDIKDSLLWIAGARERVRSETNSDDDSDDDDDYDMFDPTNDWH